MYLPIKWFTTHCLQPIRVLDLSQHGKQTLPDGLFTFIHSTLENRICHVICHIYISGSYTFGIILDKYVIYLLKCLCIADLTHIMCFLFHMKLCECLHILFIFSRMCFRPTVRIYIAFRRKYDMSHKMLRLSRQRTDKREPQKWKSVRPDWINIYRAGDIVCFVLCLMSSFLLAVY